jgi:cytochrome P450
LTIGFSFAEATAIEKRIDGYLIPSGTSILIDTIRLNKSSPIWGGTGCEFRPERWGKITTGQARYSWLGYGMGPRKCLGKNFANIIVKLFLVSVSRHFILSAEKGATEIKRDRFSCVPTQLVVFEKRNR